MLTQLLSLLAFATQVLSIPTISAKGSKFFLDSGEQFFVKGIAYQLVEDDPLANPDQCKLDAALMQTLGTNSIRVYHVQANQSHDECMQTFSDAGIYTWIDLDTFDTYIVLDQPAWNQEKFDRYKEVMDAFHDYDNVAGFFVANELLNSGADSVGAPYVKAAARDMKAYRDAQGYREIPVGYSAADIAELRPNLQNYMACGDDKSETLDFFSLNAYEWCGEQTFETSGYSMLQENATDYPIPIFFSETGCNTIQPRTFGDQDAIFGPDMSGTWSGAIIYEWIEEENDYGIISYGPPTPSEDIGSVIVDGYTRTGTPTPISPEFENLSSQWAAATPNSVSMAAYNPTNTAPLQCPEYTDGLWMVSADAPLPTLGQQALAATSSPRTSSGAMTTSGGSSSSVYGTVGMGSDSAMAMAMTASSSSSGGSSETTGTGFSNSNSDSDALASSSGDSSEAQQASSADPNSSAAPSSAAAPTGEMPRQAVAGVIACMALVLAL